jgi:septum formation protein
MRLILASASPRRAQILSEMGLRFIVAPTEVEEWHDARADPESLVRHNCNLKARAGVRLYPAKPVLAADSTVCIHGRNLGKPVDMEEARCMLRELSGRTHTVYTGVSLFYRRSGIEDTLCVRSEVTFNRLDEREIEAYFEIVDPLDKAGAYGIQDGRAMIIQSVAGSVSNVMGLPIAETEDLLRRHAIFDQLHPDGATPAVDCDMSGHIRR